MSVKQLRCAHCGAPTAPGRSAGICASCALADAFNDVGEPFDGHELLSEIARGGMGVVYRARQRDPTRDVALKTLLGVGLSSASARERFRIEVQAMATLHHPGILPVYTYGEQDGVPFYTMQLASGGTLAERRLRYQGAWREIASLVASLADAVHYAHEHGVLHRDIKPGNVLFDLEGRGFISDFGLAKLTEGDSEITHRSAMIGTPRYLAPEMISQNSQGPTTAGDVWGLGCLLYELCAQRPPFEAEHTHALLRQIVDETPSPLPKDTPRDLSVIVAKAMAKDPSARYASARDIAEDLRRWLDGRLILARPATPFEVLTTWGRRNPGLALSIVVLAVSFFVFALVEARHVSTLRVSLAQTQLREVQLLRTSGRSGQRLDSLEKLAVLARLWPEDDLVTLRTEMVAALALPDLEPIGRWPAPHVAVTGTEAFSDDLSRYAGADSGGVSIYDTASQGVVRFWPNPKAASAQEFSFSPRGDWLAIRFDDTHRELWPVATNRAVISPGSSAAFHPNGLTYLGVREKRGLMQISLADGTERQVLPPPLQQDPLILEPFGERVFVVSGGSSKGIIARIRDGAVLATISDVPFRITAFDWASDGKHLALANGEPPYAISIYNTATGAETMRFTEHLMPVRMLKFQPDGGSFAAVSAGHQLIWRSIESGGFRIQIEASSRALMFSKDGSRLGYSPTDGELGLLRVVGSDVFREWPAPESDQTGSAYTAAYSADGKWAVVASDRTLRIWDVQRRISVASKSNRQTRVWWNAVFFNPKDSSEVVWSPLGDGVWKARLDSAGALVEVTNLHRSPLSMVQEMAEGGRSMVVIDGQEDQMRAEFWSSCDPSQSRVIGLGIPFAGFRLLHGGKLGYSTHFAEADLSFWDTTTGRRVRTLGLQEPVASEPSPDGRWLLTGTRTQHILWDTTTWKPVSHWSSRAGERDVWAPTFSPDSKLLAKASPTGEITLRRIPSGEEILTLTPPQPLRLQQINFTHSGSRLMMLQANGRICEWDMANVRKELDGMKLGWRD